MKIAVIVTRVLLGVLFAFSGAAFLFNLIPVPELTGKVKLFNEGLAASGYFMPFLKGTELICGLLLISGFYVRLAIIVLFPIAINILLFHAFLAPSGVIMGVVILAALIFLAYNYRSTFLPLLHSK